jgi:two-component system cell cycle response regulator DivK
MLAIVWKARFLRDSVPRLLLFCHRRNWSMLGDPSDNELNLRLLKDILEYNGYTVLSTELGEPALELARQHRPDLILMDIQLPDISGMEAARRLKQDDQTRTIPIIAVTAFAMSGDESQILASGCDAYISKPFRIAELLTLVERWTTNRP